MRRDQTGQGTGVLAPGDGVVDVRRAPPADVWIEGDDGVRGRVDSLDARQVSVEQLACRHDLGTDEASLLDSGELHQVSHSLGSQSRASQASTSFS